MFIIRLAESFDKAGVDYAVVGGMAVALQGIARGTIDIDLAINLTRESFENAVKALEGLGLQSKLPIDAKTVFAFRNEYIERRNLIAWSFANPKAPHEVVDILLTQDRRKVKVNSISVAGYKIKVASIPDLIRMKTDSGRPQDLEDVRALKELNKK